MFWRQNLGFMENNVWSVGYLFEHQWKVSDYCEVFSASNDCWCPAKIVNIDRSKISGLVSVHYEVKGDGIWDKEIEYNSPNLRIPQDMSNLFSMPVISSSKTPQRDRLTSQFLGNVTRFSFLVYQYNEKSIFITVYDIFGISPTYKLRALFFMEFFVEGGKSFFMLRQS